jgi:ATP-dependent RNA helicase DHX8/PRP22
VDPVPEAGERHFAQELRSINIGDNLAMPEWKEQVMGAGMGMGEG